MHTAVHLCGSRRPGKERTRGVCGSHTVSVIAPSPDDLKTCEAYRNLLFVKYKWPFHSSSYPYHSVR